MRREPAENGNRQKKRNRPGRKLSDWCAFYLSAQLETFPAGCFYKSFPEHSAAPERNCQSRGLVVVDESGVTVAVDVEPVVIVEVLII